MSADSGGTGALKAGGMDSLPENSREAINAAKRQAVSRRRDVELVFSQQVAIDIFVDAITSAISIPQQIECIQSINPKKFLVSFKSEEAAEHFHRVSAPALCISGVVPSCRWLGSERKRIRVTFLPNAVPNAELVNVLKKYGDVLQVTDEVYANRPLVIKTGTRLVDMNMSKAVPNILTVCGFSVPVTYKGVAIQCRRCLQEGHLKAECRTAYCDRCKAFGHSDNDCTAPCLKCKALDHHWRECTIRSYAFAAALGTTNESPTNPTKTSAAATETRAEAVANCARATEPVTDTTVSAGAESAPVAASSPNADCSVDTSIVEDAFNSAAEYNSESELELTGVSTGETPLAQEQDVPLTCKQANEADDGRKMEWQGVNARNKKRKKVSVTSEKSPDHKKPAFDETVIVSQETPCNKLTNEAKRK